MAASFGLRPYNVTLVSPAPQEIEGLIEKQWWPTKMSTPFQTVPELKIKYSTQVTFE